VTIGHRLGPDHRARYRNRWSRPQRSPSVLAGPTRVGDACHRFCCCIYRTG